MAKFPMVFILSATHKRKIVVAGESRSLSRCPGNVLWMKRGGGGMMK